MSEIELKAFFEVTWQAIYILERDIDNIEAEIASSEEYPYEHTVENLRKLSFLGNLRVAKKVHLAELKYRLEERRFASTLENQIQQA